MKNNRAGRILGLAVAAMVLVGAASAGNRRPENPRAVEYRVQAGDTLWTVASQVPAPRADRRELVWMLKRINGLSRASLSVGQVLLLPADAASARAALARPLAFRDQVSVVDPDTSIALPLHQS